MNIKNGNLTVLSLKNKILIFTFIFTSLVQAQNIEVAPLLKLDEVQPSYEEFIDENIDSFMFEDGQGSKLIDKNYEESFAVVSLLNKITADVKTIDIKLKEFYVYEELKIYAIDCYKSEPFEKKETAVYLNIYKEGTMAKVFNGWMLKSLPSISSMEHPIYDIWVNDCNKL